MYHKLHEPCAVVGVYNQGKFIPKKFLWKNNQYAIDQLTFITDIADGNVKKRMYSAQVNGNVYRLLFNRTDEKWFVEEVWCE